MPPSSAASGTRLGVTLREASGTALLAWSALFVVLYVALDALSSVLATGPIPVKPWNPQVGLAIAAIFVGGRAIAPAVVVSAIAAEYLLRQPGGLALDLAGGLVLGAAYVATGLAFRALGADRNIARMETLRDFLGVSLIGTGVAAAGYMLAYTVTGDAGADVLREGLRKWLGDFVGTVSLAPLLLTLADVRARRPARSSLVPDVLLFSAALLLLMYWFVGFDSSDAFRPRYLLFVPLIYLAIRQGFAGAAFGVAAVQVALIAAMFISADAPESTAEQQRRMIVLAVTTLLIGSTTTERRQALSELARRSAELRAQQESLADAMRVAAASETAATLVHEMSQPLSAIGTYARAGVEMLRRAPAEPADIADVLERIERETARTSDVVRRVRDFFRTSISHREPTDVAALARAAIDGVRDRLSREQISIDLDAAADLPRADVDPVQIRTVLRALLDNAMDILASSSGRRSISVAARRGVAGDLEIDVEDSGPGPHDAVAASLFEPLATTKPDGMGLGLAIGRTIVQAHGGRLWLASFQPTRFRMTLPIHEPESD